ncbi:MAG: branched chain amino acid aminotransferase [Rhodospirillaceae bacterium]|jgi:branched-chain amino acid aminotransferase|nr:branched chain amino acid aminotransferase [Rhodospirillaceae bacterium]|tara:strand:- start:1064 stop:1897 length:834 start_codon:yes stop_codon:yes gene_type:complete
MDAVTYVDGEWLEGNPPILGARTHATWLSSIIFDGARAFEGVAPDLDLHCERAIRSCKAFGLVPTMTAQQIFDLAWEGIRKFPKDSELYIRPMFWAETGWVDPDPDSTRFAMVVYVSPLPAPTGLAVCLSSRRRPAPDMAPTDAKASCLYPNASRALREAAGKGFDNAVVRDPLNNVAELATANLFLAKDGIVRTPVPNGTFLNGVTRQRVISLLREDGIELQERTVTVADLETADEMFASGNHGKVQPITRYEDRDMQAGPLYKRARELYWAYAHR